MLQLFVKNALQADWSFCYRRVTVNISGCDFPADIVMELT